MLFCRVFKDYQQNKNKNFHVTSWWPKNGHIKIRITVKKWFNKNSVIENHRYLDNFSIHFHQLLFHLRKKWFFWGKFWVDFQKSYRKSTCECSSLNLLWFAFDFTNRFTIYPTSVPWISKTIQRWNANYVRFAGSWCKYCWKPSFSVRLTQAITAWRMSVFGVILARIFPHSGKIFFSVFSSNVGIHGPE